MFQFLPWGQADAKMPPLCLCQSAQDVPALGHVGNNGKKKKKDRHSFYLFEGEITLFSTLTSVISEHKRKQMTQKGLKTSPVYDLSRHVSNLYKSI